MKVSKWTKERCVEEARKYKTRSEFQKGASQAFHISKENGWIDEMSWFPTVEDRKPNGYWRNKDNFLREARKYSSKKEMERGNLGAYAAGLKYHYFSDVTWFNEKEKLPYGYWKDKKHCIEEARKYNSKKEFKNANQSAYGASLKYGYLEEMPWLAKKRITKRGILTKEYIMEESKKYDSRSSFKRGSPSAYSAAQRHGYLKEMTWLPSCAPNGYWNIKENVLEEARKYTSRTDFKNNGRGAYYAAIKHKWIDEIPWLKSKNEKGSYRRRRHWKTKEDVINESKKYSSRSEFNKKSRKAYEIARKNGWLDEMTWLVNKNVYIDKVDTIYKYHFQEKNAIYIGRTIDIKLRDYQHRTIINDSVNQFAVANKLDVPKMEIIETDLTVFEGMEREKYWERYYRDKGYIMVNRAKCGSVGSMAKGKWSKRKCFQEARKYKTRSEFMRGNGSAYQKSLKNKWIDEMTWLSSYHKHPRGYWKDKGHCIEEARKYSSKKEFQENNSSAYYSSLKYGYLKEMTWFNNKDGNGKER